ncbi:MAG: triose-phosphate isomerase [bacterium]
MGSGKIGSSDHAIPTSPIKGPAETAASAVILNNDNFKALNGIPNLENLPDRDLKGKKVLIIVDTDVERTSRNMFVRKRTRNKKENLPSARGQKKSRAARGLEATRARRQRQRTIFDTAQVSINVKQLDEAVSLLALLLEKGATPIVCGAIDREDSIVLMEDVAEYLGKRLPSGKSVFHHKSIDRKKGLTITREDIQDGQVNILENVNQAPDHEYGPKKKEFADDLRKLFDGLIVFDSAGDIRLNGTRVTELPLLANNVCIGPSLVKKFQTARDLLSQGAKPQAITEQTGIPIEFFGTDLLPNIEALKNGTNKGVFDSSKVEIALQTTPETTVEELMRIAEKNGIKPEDFMVVLNHSETKENLGATIRSSNKKLLEYLKAGFKIILAFGDFPIIFKGKNFLNAGIRVFPNTLEAIRKLVSNKETLSMKQQIHLGNLSEEAENIHRMSKDTFIEEYYKIPVVTKVGDETMNAWEALRQKRIKLKEAKEALISELSVKAEVLSELDELLEDVERQHLEQLLLAYEPVESIRSLAIPMDVAESRLAYIREFIADKLIAEEDEVDIIYGGGGNIKNIAALDEAGYAGAFIGRASQLASAPWKKNSTANIAQAASMVTRAVRTTGREKKRKTLIYNSKAMFTRADDHRHAYEDVDIDMSEVRIIYAVSKLDFEAWNKSFKSGKSTDELYENKTVEPMTHRIQLAVTAGVGIGEYPEGAFCGNIPVKHLRAAGVKLLLLPNEINEEQHTEWKKRLLIQLKEGGLDYAIIPEKGYEGTIQASWNEVNRFAWHGTVKNISSESELTELVEAQDVTDMHDMCICNLNIEDVRSISSSLRSQITTISEEITAKAETPDPETAASVLEAK